MGSQIPGMYLLTLFATSLESYKSLEICRKINYGLKSFQAGIDSIRPRSPHGCNSPSNEFMKLSGTSAWYYGKYCLIKSLHMLQLSEMVEP